MEQLSLPPSYWVASAIQEPASQALSSDGAADVVIVGGGLTGLSAAHELASRGVDVALLEASRFGYGGSGRNGGFVSVKFRYAFARMEKEFGLDVARRMYAIGIEANDTVERTVDALSITAADFRRPGTITAAVSERHMERLRAGIEYGRRQLGDASIALLSKDEVTYETGCDQFAGGTVSSKMGVIHPLNYVRGLAGGLLAAGVRLFSDSPVTRIETPGNGVIVHTAGGTIRAKRLILATDAYSRLTKATHAVAKGIVRVQSAIIATEPLPADIIRRIAPTDRAAFDTRRVLRYWRIKDGRMLFGGDGVSGTATTEQAFTNLRASMLSLFPFLADHKVEYRWSGSLAMTPDSLPHVGRLDDRTVFSAGYNGTGVALSSLLGRFAARISQGKTIDLALLDAARFRPAPFAPLHPAIVQVVARYHAFCDRMGR